MTTFWRVQPGLCASAVVLLSLALSLAQEAVDAPRFHHQWLPDRIDYEKRALVRDVLEALEAKGHALHQRGLIGDAQAIYVDADSGIRMGGSDPRRGGAAVGQKDDPE